MKLEKILGFVFIMPLIIIIIGIPIILLLNMAFLDFIGWVKIETAPKITATVIVLLFFIGIILITGKQPCKT